MFQLKGIKNLFVLVHKIKSLMFFNSHLSYIDAVDLSISTEQNVPDWSRIGFVSAWQLESKECYGMQSTTINNVRVIKKRRALAV